MKIVIFGSGGVGGYFGARLAQAGEEVTFIARGQHLQAIRRNGLQVESILGNFSIQPARATDAPAEIGPVDLVIVGVKAWQIPEAAEAIRPLVGPETMVLPLENGISAPTELGAVLGSEHILGGLCRISALIGKPGVIRHVGIQPVIVFGECDNSRSERIERLQQAFSKCQGLTAQVPVDINTAMWEKFIFIVTVSSIGAATRQPIGGYRAVPESRKLLQAALEEVAAVGRAKGVTLREDIAARILAGIDATPADTYASMQNDIMNGKPSELEAQTGTVVRMGRELGVLTPMHDYLYAILLPMEMQARRTDRA
jgi:2-dehydropantoate 2-reductase